MSKPIIGIVSKHIALNNIRPNTFIRDEVKKLYLITSFIEKYKK